MKSLLVACLLSLSSVASAAPYFRIKPFNRVDAGAFFKIGTPQGSNTNLGVMTPVIWHDSADGYWLVPGVDWALLNIGIVSATEMQSGHLILGPSVALDGPAKAFLRTLVDALPGSRNGGYASLRSILKPVAKDEQRTYLSVGPMWGIDTGNWRGSLFVGTTLSSRF